MNIKNFLILSLFFISASNSIFAGTKNDTIGKEIVLFNKVRAQAEPYFNGQLMHVLGAEEQARRRQEEERARQEEATINSVVEKTLYPKKTLITSLINTLNDCRKTPVAVFYKVIDFTYTCSRDATEHLDATPNINKKLFFEKVANHLYIIIKEALDPAKIRPSAYQSIFKLLMDKTKGKRYIEMQTAGATQAQFEDFDKLWMKLQKRFK